MFLGISNTWLRTVWILLMCLVMYKFPSAGCWSWQGHRDISVFGRSHLKSFENPPQLFTPAGLLFRAIAKFNASFSSEGFQSLAWNVSSLLSYYLLLTFFKTSRLTVFQDVKQYSEEPNTVNSRCAFYLLVHSCIHSFYFCIHNSFGSLIAVRHGITFLIFCQAKPFSNPCVELSFEELNTRADVSVYGIWISCPWEARKSCRSWVSF